MDFTWICTEKNIKPIRIWNHFLCLHIVQMYTVQMYMFMYLNEIFWTIYYIYNQLYIYHMDLKTFVIYQLNIFIIVAMLF